MTDSQLDQIIVSAISTGKLWDASELDRADVNGITLSSSFEKRKNAIIRKYSSASHSSSIGKSMAIAAAVAAFILSLGVITVVAIEPLRESAYNFLSEWVLPATEEPTEAITETETEMKPTPQTPPPGVEYSTGLVFSLSDDGSYYSVTGVGSCTDNAVYIPPMHMEIPVMVIGKSAFKRSRADNIFVPEGVKIIEDSAFEDCSAVYIQPNMKVKQQSISLII